MIWNMKNPEITRKKMDRGMSRLKMKEYINCETEGLIRLVCGCGDEKGREKQFVHGIINLQIFYDVVV